MLKIILAALIGAGLLAGCGSRSIATPGALSGTSAGNTTSSVSSLASNYSTVVWEDDFRTDPAGAPSSTYWAAETGNGVEYGNAGWGNNEAEYYLPGDATVASGALLLHGHADTSVIAHNCGTTTINNCLFSSAKITSLKTVDLSKPGFLEVEADLPTGVGSWPAIWLLPGTSPGAAFPPSQSVLSAQPLWPIGGEIDMAEWLGTYFAGQDSLVQSTLHLPSGTPSPAYTDSYQYQKATLASPLSGNYHLYQLAWTSGSIEFAIDNQPVMTCTRSSMSCTPVAAGVAPYPASAIWPYGNTYSSYYLIMNLAIGGNLGAPHQDNTQVPSNYDQTMRVAYVRYMTP